MIRNLLIVLGLLLCFAIGGAGVYRYLSSRGETPFLKAAAADLAGTWQNQATRLKIEASGDTLKVNEVDYVRDGKSARWVEKSPQAQVPKVLEWNGTVLTLTSVDDSGQRLTQSLQRAK